MGSAFLIETVRKIGLSEFKLCVIVECIDLLHNTLCTKIQKSLKFFENLKQKPRHGIVAPKPVGLVKIKRKRTQIVGERAYEAPLKGKWSAL